MKISKMKEPFVSVVIPAYNAAKTLKTTVKSVFEQTIQDFEIIIVDDGSKDNTLKVAREIADSDSRVKVITQPNGGAPEARNTGIKTAQGEYVALLDADDLWMPHKLERQLEFLSQHKDVNAVISGAYYVNNNLEVLSVVRCFESKDVLLETLLFQNLPATQSTIIIKRKIFDEIGLFDTGLVILEDWELLIRLARFGNLKTIEEPLSLYRIYPGNRSRNLDIHIKPGYKVLERLFSDPHLPLYIKKRKRLIYATFYQMLCGSAFTGGRFGQFFKWGAKALFTHPLTFSYMASLPLRKLQRSFSRLTVPPEFNLVTKKFLGEKNSKV